MYTARVTPAHPDRASVVLPSKRRHNERATMLNYASLLSAAAQRHPERIALQCNDHSSTYAELLDQVERMSVLLRSHGLQRGDRVALVIPNIPEFLIAFWGALWSGCVLVPMNPLLKAREMEFYLRNSGAKAVIFDASIGDEVLRAMKDVGLDLCWSIAPSGRKPVENDLLVALGGLRDDNDADIEATNADDPAVILYTSGTTGKPKGAVLSHSNLSWNAEIFSRTCLTLTYEDVVYAATPLFHSMGQTLGMGSAIRAGACLVLLPRFSGEAALELIDAANVSVMLGVPTMYMALLEVARLRGTYPTTLRVCATGGAPTPVEVLRAFERDFGCIILEGYGLSETSPLAAFNQPSRPRKIGSIGLPADGVEMRVVDTEGRALRCGEVGEIQIRGHNIMLGYLGRPDATAEAIDPRSGWFSSGDLGYADEEGYYFIVDRKKDLIIRGGYNIYPREVEEVLYEHPGVLEAAVIGTPHPTLGEEVAAVVVMRPDHTFDAEELQQWCKDRVAAYKYPRLVLPAPALPKGSTGKILKREIEISTPTPAASS